MALNMYKYGIIICMFLKSVILFSKVGNSHQEVASYHNIVKNYEKFKKNITYRLVNLGVQLIHLRVHRPIWCLDYMLPQSITIYNSSKIPLLSQEMRVNYQGEAQGGGGE